MKKPTCGVKTRPVYFLECAWDEQNCEGESEPCATPEEAIKEARESGWRKVSGVWLCEECLEFLSAEPSWSDGFRPRVRGWRGKWFMRDVFGKRPAAEDGMCSVEYIKHMYYLGKRYMEIDER